MKVKILAIGKVKERYLNEGLKDYSRRLKPYCHFEILEGPELEAPERLSEAEKRQLVAKEGQFFLQKLGDGYTIALDGGGKLLTSAELAGVIEDKGMMEGKTLQFLIGGSLGLSEEVKAKSQLLLSFGRVTFPHQLIRLFLAEQVYRSMKIIRNEPYHK